jgi:SPP1 family phage portal protein
MNAQDVILSMDFKQIELLFKGSKPKFDVETEKAINQYQVKGHDIFDETIRPDKTIKKDTETTDADNKRQTITELVPVARVGLPYQKLIVNRRVGFMLSNPVTVSAIYAGATATQKEKDLIAMVEKIQNDNKMDYKNKEIARRMMSEMECAELWYLEPPKEKGEQFSLKIKIISPDLGDTLYPLFDNTGDMIAFARKYMIKEGDTDIEHFDVYTPEFEYKYVLRDNTWQLDQEVNVWTKEGQKVVNPVPNAVNKIMVVYHSQKKPEWNDVQTMIDRQEELVSNHADMNDYFGSPILAISGQVLGFASKGEQGKIIELSDAAKANYLALSSPPESIKMEVENLEKFIYSMSQTPNISFEQLMSIGGQISGVALKMMFLDAHMAVNDKEEIFGIGLQRRLNLIKAVIGAVIDTRLAGEAKTLQLKPVITPYLPSNDTEMIDNLSVAKTSGIISKETAVEINPLVEDAETELQRIQKDNSKEIAGIPQ